MPEEDAAPAAPGSPEPPELDGVLGRESMLAVEDAEAGSIALAGKVVAALVQTVPLAVTVNVGRVVVVVQSAIVALFSGAVSPRASKGVNCESFIVDLLLAGQGLYAVKKNTANTCEICLH